MADARRFRAPPEVIAALHAELIGAGHQDGVWPENAAAVAAFLVGATQWRVLAAGGGLAPARLIWLGLDYAGARAGIEASGIAITPALWRDLTTMEAAAIAALNERR